MEDNHEKKEQSFIREHIVPRKNAKKIISTVLATAGLALLFGLIAGVAFFVSQNIMEANNPTVESEPEESTSLVPFSRDESVEESTDPEAEQTGGSIESSEPEPSENEPAAETTAAITLKSVYRDLKDGLVRITVSRSGGESVFGTPIVRQETTFGIFVAETDSSLYALFDGNLLSDGEIVSVTHNSSVLSAALLGTDALTGLSALEIRKNSVVNAYKVIPLGNSNFVSVMDNVYLIGAQTGAFGSADEGIVTFVSTYEDLVDGYRQRILTNMLRKAGTAGALVNVNGEIIGWVSDRTTESGTGAEAYGISSLKYLIEDLCSGADTAYIGIEGRPISAQEMQAAGLPGGYYISRIVPDSPAFDAGLQAGDRILSLAGTGVSSSHALQDVIDGLTPGEQITVTVSRQITAETQENVTAEVTVGTRP